jgi:hypothetical protein
VYIASEGGWDEPCHPSIYNVNGKRGDSEKYELGTVRKTRKKWYHHFFRGDWRGQKYQMLQEGHERIRIMKWPERHFSVM